MKSFKNRKDRLGKLKCKRFAPTSHRVATEKKQRQSILRIAEKVKTCVFGL